jgi:hypothetical protein
VPTLPKRSLTLLIGSVLLLAACDATPTPQVDRDKTEQSDLSAFGLLPDGGKPSTQRRGNYSAGPAARAVLRELGTSGSSNPDRQLANLPKLPRLPNLPLRYDRRR